MAQFNTRIKLKRDTSANWTTADPVLLDGEIIIVDTASGDVRKKVGDGTKKYSQLPFDDEEVLNAIGDKSDPSGSVSVTLTAAGWSDNQQTISVTGLTANQNGSIGLAQSATSEQIDAARKACMYVCAQSAGSLTIAAKDDVPTVDIPVVVVLLG